MNPWRFYVYIHRTEDTGEPFYVGKGVGTRAWQWGRNSAWEEVATKRGRKVEIFAFCQTEEIAYALEKSAIAQFSREALLTNQTMGGGGCRDREALERAEKARKRMLALAERRVFKQWCKALNAASPKELATFRQELEQSPVPKTPTEGHRDREKWRRLTIAESKFKIEGAPRPSMWTRYSPEQRAAILAKRRRVKAFAA